ncbi:hypothetical protein [Arthrobacter oryzae]|uniref:Polysaccharide lyase-like protein n=1 Tax=Arthrobacter oryzae TaxID=409290 RepID=A0A495ERP0_9MICC|nr:hypothetical protein [Arthrobacter oryzae]RKR19422.1 hypothetical protein C8D78_2169 [Arthrobacter oryzae]
MNRVVKLCFAGSLVLAILAVPALSLGPETAGAQACVPSAGPPADPYPGTTAAASSFESGTLDGFGVSTSGTGKASVSTAQSHSGNCAAVLHATATPGSIARMTAALTPGATEAYADGWFNIAGEGKVGNNVPYFRFFADGIRVMDVFRQNITHELVLRTSTPAGFTYTTLRQEVPTGTWHRLVLHVVPNGPGTNVQIWWDGRSVFAGPVSTAATTLDTVQLGSEHDQQMADIYIDDVIVNSGTGQPAPVPGSLPAPRGNPSQPLNDFRGDRQPAVLAVGGRDSRAGLGRRPVRTPRIR